MPKCGDNDTVTNDRCNHYIRKLLGALILRAMHISHFYSLE